MLDLALIGIQVALVYVLAGMAVRLAMFVQGGFDLLPAVTAVLAAEVAIALFARYSNWVLQGIGGLLIALLVVILASYIWALATKHLFARGIDGNGIMLTSFGLLILVSGVVGALRGPGLVAADFVAGRSIILDGGGIILSMAALLSIGLSLALLVGVLGFRHTNIGYALRLYSMNPQFAAEIGINKSQMRRTGLILAGLLGAGAGLSMALVNGSTPELGLKVFLYGAGAALLFESRTLWAPIAAGTLLGSAHVALQLVVAPAWAESLMFTGIVALVLAKGNGRDIGGNR